MNKKKKFPIIPIIIISIILLGLIGVGIYFLYPTTQSTITLPDGTTCYDSDSGYNLYVYGYIQTTSPSGLQTPKQYDYCYSDTILIEQGCTEGAYDISCGTGETCQNGKCVFNEPVNKCPSGTSYCSSSTLNSRYTCDPNTGNVNQYTCSSGKVCSNGNCINDEQQSTCYDSDSGYNPYIYGYIQTTTSSGLQSQKQYDYCYSDTILIEQGCENGAYDISCGTGKICQDGECISDTKSTYYRFSNNNCNQIQLYSSEVTSNDYITLSECQSHIVQNTKSTYYRFSNNNCNQIQLYSSEVTSNDYATLQECQSKITQDGDGSSWDIERIILTSFIILPIILVVVIIIYIATKPKKKN